MALSGEKSSTIVLVEETPSSLGELTAVLEGAGCVVRSVRDAGAAVARVCSDQADLCIVATGAPSDSDGLSALRVIRASEAYRHFPVFVTSPRVDPSLAIAALRLGADDYFEQPLDYDRLLARLRRCLELKSEHDLLTRKRVELEELSVTDGLTQVKNHRFFQARLREEFRRAQRYEDPLALILVDLDHFKSVNDRYGHQVGDQVLQDVARCLTRSVRETDLVARYGGEEFAVVLPKTHLAGSLTVAERIWRDLGSLTAGPGGNLRVTASLGVSGYPARGIASQEQLVRTADEALYRAKREGRNKICLFQQAAAPGNSDAAAKVG